MWELYAFWAFVPVMIATYNTQYPNENLDVSFLAFVIIASGGLACVLGGLLSQRYGAKKIATLALTLSCACCLLSPLFLFHSSSVLFISFLLFWGMTVVADSPLFSSLVALHAPEETRGTSLTAVTCIGFAITIISIQLVSAFGVPQNQLYIYTLLSAGPIMGLVALLKK
jgi:MFS family permease